MTGGSYGSRVHVQCVVIHGTRVQCVVLHGSRVECPGNARNKRCVTKGQHKKRPQLGLGLGRGSGEGRVRAG